MMPPLSRRGDVAPFLAMEMLTAANARAAAGGDVIHMEVGQPSTPAPRLAREAAIAAIGAGATLGYTEALGIPSLRAGIARWYRHRHGVDIAAERVVVTTGSSAGFILAFLACFDAGQRVGLAEPAYPAYRNILGALDLQSVGLPVGDAERWQLQTAMLAARNDIDGVVLASPANPTGTMIGAAELALVSADCAARGRPLIVDEIYHGIEYGPAAGTVLALGDHPIVVNSFSKYFSMTGWRIGWLVVPPHLVRTIERLAQNLFISPPAISQVAAEAALAAEDELAVNVATYARNRDILLNELPAAGFGHFAPPDGAFYIYLDVAHRTADSAAFCRRLLAEQGIAATPGADFDPARGSRFIRLSYAGATADMIEAARRLKAWRA